MYHLLGMFNISLLLWIYNLFIQIFLILITTLVNYHPSLMVYIVDHTKLGYKIFLEVKRGSIHAMQPLIVRSIGVGGVGVRVGIGAPLLAVGGGVGIMTKYLYNKEYKNQNIFKHTTF
ncbi:hypothetical protein ACJX0J_037141 [Zea mays]